MNTTQPNLDTLGSYKEELTKRKPQLPDWLLPVCEKAMEQFMEHGFPSRRQELWKYTDTRPIAKRTFQSVATGQYGAPEQLIEDSRLDSAHCLVFINGHFSAQHSDTRTLDGGIIVAPLSQMLQCDSKETKIWLEHQSIDKLQGFDTLNLALASDGYFIRVPDHTVIDRPIQILSVACHNHTHPTAAHLRNRVVIGHQSKARIIESFIGNGKLTHLTNVVTDIKTEEGSHLELTRVQNDPAGYFYIGKANIEQDRDSRFDSHQFSFGASLARQDTNVRLQGEGASCALNGLYLGQGRQHTDHHTRVDHLKPHTESEECYKGIVGGAARAVFNGKVVVHPGADGTDAKQSNDNLLLSDRAEVDTKPELEIYADDVKCSHGATTGQLDEDSLFYLRSRGLDTASARNLLTLAFGREIISRNSHEELARKLENTLAECLPESSLHEDKR